MDNKDKIYELELNSNVIGGKLKIQNSNNRVVAKIGDVFLDRLNYYRWNNAVKFLDKYEKKGKIEAVLEWKRRYHLSFYLKY